MMLSETSHPPKVIIIQNGKRKGPGVAVCARHVIWFHLCAILEITVIEMENRLVDALFPTTTQESMVSLN